MSERQTEAEFREHLNTTFHVQLDASKAIDVKLVAVESRVSEANEQAGMERFSAFFLGPADFFLPQNIYRVAHPQMGEFDLFLVAIGKDAEGFRYEAVYNYFKK